MNTQQVQLSKEDQGRMRRLYEEMQSRAYELGVIGSRAQSAIRIKSAPTKCRMDFSGEAGQIYMCVCDEYVCCFSCNKGPVFECAEADFKATFIG